MEVELVPECDDGGNKLHNGRQLSRQYVCVFLWLICPNEL